jgi:hypothetical protein
MGDILDVYYHMFSASTKRSQSMCIYILSLQGNDERRPSNIIIAAVTFYYVLHSVFTPSTESLYTKDINKT